MTLQLIGWAIIHSLWQGGVIALVTAGLLGATRRARPNTRYVIALVALAAMFVLPIATASRGSNEAVEYPSISSSVSASTGISASPSPTPTASSSSSPNVTPATPTSEPAATASETVISGLETSLPWLVAAWMIGLLIASVRLIGGFARTRRITRNATAKASRALELRIEKICERIGIARAVRVLESTAIDVPLVIGAIRPVVVVPVSLISGLTPLQLDMLLAHELAHVRRHDYLVNLVQTIVETLLFYHPAARWISDRAREERENCCDDIAMETCAVDPAQYTSTLLILEEARGEGFGLAAAASGGSLLRRAQRLMTGRTYVELGPRWIAGVITIGAALFAGNEALAGIQAAYVPSIPALVDSVDKKGKAVDNGRASPSSVTKAPAGGTIAERWRWAERNGGSEPYWIGYLIADDPTSNSRFYTSELPVRLSGNLTLSGSMNFGDGDLSNVIFTGVPLAPLFGAHDPRATAIFLRVQNGALGRRIEKVHMGTFALPGYFDRRRVIWLDSAADGESIALITSLMESTRDRDVRRNLVSVLGVHSDANAVVPKLIAILQSRDEDDVRREAAEWLGRKGDGRAIGALSRAARTDRAEGVRRESVEAFQHMKTAAATDTLTAFVGSLATEDLRREAIESLGQRNDDRALEYLTRFVRSSEYASLRREAIESLAEMEDGRGMNAVIDVARNDRSAEVRREAVESLAQLEPTSRAFDLLREIVRMDPDESVQSEAVETIAEVHDARSVSILAEIANRNPSQRIQEEAVESLGETVAPEAAFPIVREIARKHPVPRVRKKALEVMIEFHDDATSIKELINVVRTDPDEDVREAALEALGDGNDAAAMKTLESFINGKDPVSIREKALEVYVDAASDKDAMAILKAVMSKDADTKMRRTAAELLKDR